MRAQIPSVAALDGSSVSLLVANRQVVYLNPEAAVEVDARAFSELLDRPQPSVEALTQAIELYRGDFLSDFYLPGSNPFEEWVLPRREAYRRRALLALERLGAAGLTDNNFVVSERYARRQLAIDPLHEMGHRQLIEALARDGRRSAALAHFDSYSRLLEEELGVSPGAETLALVESVQSGNLSPAAWRPDHIRSYQVHEEIGRGRHGVVYRASQPAVGRDVAIKVIPAGVADDVAFIRRFEIEAQTIARLEHPQIVPLHDYWRESGSAYLVMRYLRGGNLKATISGAGWPLGRVGRLLEQLAGALHTAHRKGTVHRDMKPANVLLDEDGNAYLTDFGIALWEGDKASGSEESLNLAGTPAYIAPEQALNEPVTPLSDQYSLALVIFEVITGQSPFAADSLVELLDMHVHEPLPSLRAIRPDVPTTVDDVLARAAAKRPADRYPDVIAFAQAFTRAIATSQGESRASTPAELGPEPANPYKGLHAFTEADAHVFYGRESLTLQLLERLGKQHGKDRFLAVVGPSGSGKSSLVRAGLVPALRRGALPGSERWFIVDMIPGARPFEELESALRRIAVNPPAMLLAHLREGDPGLLRAIRSVLPADEDSELLLIIDQFEEIFTLAPDRETTRQFLGGLVAAVTDPASPLRVVVTLRADFHDQPLLYPGLSELVKASTEVVVPLSTDELVRAIEQPAVQAGVTVQPELMAALVTEVSEQPGALPLLQYTLARLFERREQGRLTLEAYRGLGGVSGALAQRAESVYEGLDDAGQAAARALFLRLVTLGEGVEDTRRRVRRAELTALDVPAGARAEANAHPPAPVSDAIDAFGRAHLLSFDHDPATRGPTVELAHEALLRAWPRLQQWMNESRAERRLAHLLTQAADEWTRVSFDGGFLLRGARLDQLAPLREGAVALTAGERDFLDASLAARYARQAAEEARRQAELTTAQKLAETERQRADEQARDARRLRQRAALLLGAVSLASILALVALLFARQAQTSARVAESQRAVAVAAEATAGAEADVRATAEAEARAQQATAEEQARLASSRELTQAALNTLETDAELSVLLSLQALEIARTKEAQDALHRALQASRTRKAFDGITDLIDAPEGPLLVTVGPGEITLLNPVTDAARSVTIEAYDPSATYRPFISPDGGELRFLSCRPIAARSRFRHGR